MKNILFCLVLSFFPIHLFAQETQSDTCTFYSPNTITPDCDQFPCEGFQIVSNCPMDNFHLTIFNRWGEKVFETKDQNEVWFPWNDQKTDLPEGVYFWILSFVKQTDEDMDGILEEQEINRNGYLTFIK